MHLHFPAASGIFQPRIVFSAWFALCEEVSMSDSKELESSHQLESQSGEKVSFQVDVEEQSRSDSKSSLAGSGSEQWQHWQV